MDILYNKDFNLWLDHTAELLKNHRFQELDLNNLIEEIEKVSKSEKRAIASQLTRLLLHLLKWQNQTARRSDSWLDSITDARVQIDLAIEDSPSLKNYPYEKLEQSYARARRGASKQTGMALSVFPVKCPYSLEEILNENWLPE